MSSTEPTPAEERWLRASDHLPVMISPQTSVCFGTFLLSTDREEQLQAGGPVLVRALGDRIVEAFAKVGHRVGLRSLASDWLAGREALYMVFGGTGTVYELAWDSMRAIGSRPRGAGAMSRVLWGMLGQEPSRDRCDVLVDSGRIRWWQSGADGTFALARDDTGRITLEAMEGPLLEALLNAARSRRPDLLDDPSP